MWIWCTVISLGFALTTKSMSRAIGCKNRLLDTMGWLSVLGGMAVCITLNHSIENWNPKRVCHWIGTFFFGVCLVCEILLFLFLNRKKDKKLVGFMIVLLVAVVMVFVCFGIFGKNGYIEMIPIAFYQIFSVILNLYITRSSKCTQQIKPGECSANS